LFGRPAAPDGPTYEELQAHNEALERVVAELSVLNELAGEIGASFNSRYIISKIVDRSRRATGAEQASVTLLTPGSPAAAGTLWRDLGSGHDREHYHVDRHLLGWMLHHRKPLLSNDPHHDERLRGANLPASVRSLLCLPLLLRLEVIGVLAVTNKRHGGFDGADQRLLGIIAMQSAQVVENARLFEESKLLDSMRGEVRLAQEIQQHLLPAAAPAVPGYELAGISLPAREVGGDYYDFIPLEDGRLALALGDVSGKGLPASLLMANLQAALRGQLFFEPSAAACARRVNRHLHRCTATHRFATLFLGLLDPVRHEVVTCNAGHERPLHCRGDGAVERPAAGGLPLGVLEDFDYEEQTTALAPGDLLLLYSDGVTDAESPGAEPFGEERLLAVARGARGAPAGEVVARVVDAVRGHVRDAAPFDDITLLALRRLE
jgi:serine phosphatase RsbU (regulator of sigma subunit)